MAGKIALRPRMIAPSTARSDSMLFGLTHMEVETALYLRIDVSQNRMAWKTHPSALVPMPSPKP